MSEREREKGRLRETGMYIYNTIGGCRCMGISLYCVTVWSIVDVVLPEAVISQTIVTEEDTTFFTIPHCFVSFSLVLVAVTTAMSSPCPTDWKVSLTKVTRNWSTGWTTRALSALVVADQLLRKSRPEIFHGLERQVSDIE